MADLTQLKNVVLDELISLTDSNSLDPAERYDLLMTQYANSGDVTLLDQAVKAAKEISDVSVKGTALIQILEEINIAIDESSPMPEATDTGAIEQQYIAPSQ